MLPLTGVDLVEQGALALIHTLWEGVLIAALAATALRVARRHSPRLRYGIAVLGLALLALMPIVNFLALSRAAQATPPLYSVHTLTPADGHGMPSWLVPTGAGPAVDFADTGSTVFSWQFTLLLAYLLGVGICALRLLASANAVRRLGSEGARPAAPRHRVLLDGLLARLDWQHPVALLESSLARVPTVIGWWKPKILLPAGCLLGLTPNQLEAILAHELAHIRRHDYLVNLLQCVVEVFLFYHPAAWWLSRCIRDERELCCDDLAVALLDDRRGYARALARLAELRAEPVLAAPALGADGGSVVKRIRRLVREHEIPEPGHRAGLPALLLVGAVLFIGAALRGPLPAQEQEEPRNPGLVETAGDTERVPVEPVALPEVEIAELPPVPVPQPGHVVEVGDTLHAIARRYGITMKRLRALNPELARNLLRVGQRLQLPPYAAVHPPLRASGPYVAGENPNPEDGATTESTPPETTPDRLPEDPTVDWPAHRMVVGDLVVTSGPSKDADLRGQVVATAGDQEGAAGVIVISIGSDDGVKPGQRFVVHRHNRYIGEIVINQVKPDLSAGSIQRPGTGPTTGTTNTPEVVPPSREATLRPREKHTIYGKVLVAGPRDHVFVISLGESDGVTPGQEIIVFRKDHFVALGSVQKSGQDNAVVKLTVAGENMVVGSGDAVMIRGARDRKPAPKPADPFGPRPRTPGVPAGENLPPAATPGSTEPEPTPALEPSRDPAPHAGARVSALVVAAPTEKGVMVLGVGAREGIGPGWTGLAFRGETLLGRVQVVRGVRGLSTVRFQSRRTGIELEVGDQVELRAGGAPAESHEL